MDQTPDLRIDSVGHLRRAEGIGLLQRTAEIDSIEIETETNRTIAFTIVMTAERGIEAEEIIEIGVCHRVPERGIREITAIDHPDATVIDLTSHEVLREMIVTVDDRLSYSNLF